MTVIRTNPNYPDTSTRGPETPIGVLVRKVDRNYDKERARDLAYKFTRRNFFEDPLNHGVYLLTGDLNGQGGDFFMGDFDALDFYEVAGNAEASEQNGHDYPPGPDPMEGAIYRGT